jgi:hypothetical protein
MVPKYHNCYEDENAYWFVSSYFVTKIVIVWLSLTIDIVPMALRPSKKLPKYCISASGYINVSCIHIYFHLNATSYTLSLSLNLES